MKHLSQLITDLGNLSGAQPLSTWADTEYFHFSNFDRQTDPVHDMMFRDTVGYLCDDILTKVDRASMATSLETRIPMLDHRVAKLAWSLPASMKIRNGKGKWILRQVLNKHVPHNLIERPKQDLQYPLVIGFAAPCKTGQKIFLMPIDYPNKAFLTQKLFSTDGKNIYQVKEIGKTGCGLF